MFGLLWYKVLAKMLSSSLYTMLKLSKASSPQKLFDYDRVTLYKISQQILLRLGILNIYISHANGALYRVSFLVQSHVIFLKRPISMCLRFVQKCEDAEPVSRRALRLLQGKYTLKQVIHQSDKLYQKPTKTHLLEQVIHLTKRALLHETYILLGIH